MMRNSVWFFLSLKIWQIPVNFSVLQGRLKAESKMESLWKDEEEGIQLSGSIQLLDIESFIARQLHSASMCSSPLHIVVVVLSLIPE